MTAPHAYAAIEEAFANATTRDAIDALSDEQRRELHEYWVDRANGELTTALTFRFMLDDLTKENVPFPVLELARQAIEDEHRHVEWCLRWACQVDPAACSQATVGGTEPLTFAGASAHDNRLLRTVFGCCFSETVAVHVLLASQAHIAVESVRKLNHQHLKEEVGHARLGWALLGWRELKARDREMIRAHVPEMEELTRLVWQSGGRPNDERLEQLGFLSSRIVDAACDDAIASVVLPGLAGTRTMLRASP
jgi:hypothetical protein